jgi:hypothetical protein
MISQKIDLNKRITINQLLKNRGNKNTKTINNQSTPTTISNPIQNNLSTSLPVKQENIVNWSGQMPVELGRLQNELILFQKMARDPEIAQSKLIAIKPLYNTVKRNIKKYPIPLQNIANRLLTRFERFENYSN